MKNSWLLIYLLCTPAFAQDDLLKLLAEEKEEATTFTTQTFKSTRLVNGQTIETKGAGELEFIFAHRFGALDSGWPELFGLDQAFVRLGLEYGITDRLGVGFGRNSVDKTMDGYVRYKLIRQSTGALDMPFSVTVLTNAAIIPKRIFPQAGTIEDRMSYTFQLLVARKFSPAFSLQVMPTLVHKNLVDQSIENNSQPALGVGGRLKVSRSMALTSEYYYRLGVPDANDSENAFGVGIDIETGGHVFQLVITNSRLLTERAFITENPGGTWHLGFNVTRTFQVRKRRL